MYPVPAEAETYGRTEAIIGSWLAAARPTRARSSWRPRSPGRSTGSPMPAAARPALDAPQHRGGARGEPEAASRPTMSISTSSTGPSVSCNTLRLPRLCPRADDAAVPIEETLAVLDELVGQGKIRAIGLSNETPWGTMRFLAARRGRAGPRVASIQNAYSLLNRSFEVGLAEVALREECGLLAYSPLAMGASPASIWTARRPARARHPASPTSCATPATAPRRPPPPMSSSPGTRPRPGADGAGLRRPAAASSPAPSSAPRPWPSSRPHRRRASCKLPR